MSRRILLIGIILYAALGKIVAQGQVTATLDKTKILIGDHLHLTANVKLNDANATVKDILFADIDTVGGVEILQTSDLMKANDKTGLWEKSITLTSFEEGHYVLPRVFAIVNINGTEKRFYSNTLGFDVSAPEVDEETKLQPIKGIEHEPINFRDVLPYFLGLLLIAGIVLWIRNRSKRVDEQKEEPIPEIVLPPHEIALNKLANLEKKQLWQQGQVKEFQSELTFILREYLEGRYQIPALESTTSEIIRDMKDVDISEEQTKELKRILETADMVKFAKSEPPIEVHQQAFDAIKAFIINTRKKIDLQQPNDEEENND